MAAVQGIENLTHTPHTHGNALLGPSPLESPPSIEPYSNPAENPLRVAQWIVETPHETGRITLMGPEDRAWDGMFLFASGLGGYGSRRIVEALARRKVATGYYEPLSGNGGSLIEDILHPQELHIATQRATMNSIASNRFQINNQLPDAHQLDLDDITWVNHSMGNISTPVTAEYEASRTRALISIAGAGYGSPSLSKFLLQVPGILKDEMLMAATSGQLELDPKRLYEFMRYLARQPLRAYARFNAEALSCVNTDITPTMLKLGDLGVKTVFLGLGKDRVIITDDIRSKAQEVNDIYDELEGHSHVAPLIDPEPVADAVVAAHFKLAA